MQSLSGSRPETVIDLMKADRAVSQVVSGCNKDTDMTIGVALLCGRLDSTMESENFVIY